LKQKDIAELLHIQSAAVSQYVKEKRGHSFDFDEQVLKEIKISAENITNQQSMMGEIQRLLHVVREQQVLCQIHKKFSDVPRSCDPEKVGCCSTQGGLVHVGKKT